MKDDRLYLIHILECIDRVEQYTSEGRQTFLNDTKTQDATVRNLQVLAESSKRISEQLKAAHPEIEWRKIAGFTFGQSPSARVATSSCTIIWV